MNRLETKKTSNDKKKMLIIILMILATLLGLLLCFFNVINNLKEMGYITEKVSVDELNDNINNYTIEDILKSFGCGNINYSMKEDKEKHEKRYCEINLSFKYDLYEKNESNEKYFNSIVEMLRKKHLNCFELNDENKGIYIFYDYENNIYTINESSKFFADNNFLEVVNHKAIKSNDSACSSTDLYKIIQNQWNRYGLKLGSKVVNSDDEWIDYGSFKYHYTGTSIDYIVFYKDYESEVIDGIKVDTERSKVEDVMGKPTFNDSNKSYGYKTINGYVYFYEDRIEVYPNKEYINIDFEKDVWNFCKGKYNGDRTSFVVKIKESYPDFNSQIIDENKVRLYSFSRGVEFTIDSDKKTEITIYDNYSISSVFKPFAKSKIIKIDYENDTINSYKKEFSD